jgi:hypothetical protein
MKGGTAMDIKVGDTFKSSLDKMAFAVKKIVNDMVLLESPDRKRQIVTGVATLKLEAFYLKKENKEL